MRTHYYYLILFFTFVFLSCGEINETERITIDVRVNPEGAGTVLTSGGAEIGNTAEFLAVENSGWTFAGWSGDVNSFENPVQVELVDDLEIVGNFALFVNNYIVSITLSDPATSVDLAFGQRPGATDGFDSGTDAEAPPPPPDILHAWFEIGSLLLFEDFRNAFSPEVDWNLKLENVAPGQASLQWNLEVEEFSGTLTLTSPQSDIAVDMVENNSFEFNPDNIDEFTILFRL